MVKLSGRDCGSGNYAFGALTLLHGKAKALPSKHRLDIVSHQMRSECLKLNSILSLSFLDSLEVCGIMIHLILDAIGILFKLQPLPGMGQQVGRLLSA